MDGYTAGKRVVNGQITDRCWGAVASLLIHVSIHVKMDWIVTHCLLAHVLEFHARYMNSAEALLHLIMMADKVNILHHLEKLN